MSSTPHRGEVWLCRHGDKVRPVIVVSREQVHARLAKITVVPVSSADRGWPDEVRFAAGEAGLRLACVAQCREIAHIPKTLLVNRIGDASHRLPVLCDAITAVIGC
jgi:mRNA-degrading endonuclease toxin of MazEF toxin-antitoxin module